MITLTRMYTPWGVVGDWSMPDFQCKTLERPWLVNVDDHSCIPEGVYTMALRESPVVKRITKGKFDKGWEIQNVPDRDFIMVHPGNWISDSNGCILTGKHALINADRIMITESQSTFEQLMTALGTKETWEIEILPFRVEYP